MSFTSLIVLQFGAVNTGQSANLTYNIYDAGGTLRVGPKTNTCTEQVDGNGSATTGVYVDTLTTLDPTWAQPLIVKAGISGVAGAFAGMLIGDGLNPSNSSLLSIDSSGRVISQYPLHKDIGYNNFTFNLFSSAGSPVTGATVAGQVSIDGGAYTNLTNSVVEIGSGTYKVNLAAADLNGTNICLKFTATGAIQVNVTLPMSA